MQATAAGQGKREVQLSSGRIAYREGGEGPAVLFVHGFLVDSRLWDGVTAALAGCRWVAPDLPFAAHTIPMDPGADLSPPGVAALLAELIEALDLGRPTVVGNDSGGAMSQVLAARHPDRVGRLALTNCDTHENFPPGVFRVLPPLVKLPGGMAVATLPFRSGAISRAVFRPFTKRPIPPELIASWIRPAISDPAVARDARKLIAGMNRRHTLAAAEALEGSELPLLLAWAPGDRLFPISYAERLLRGMPNSWLEPIEGAGTFVPLDQPEVVAAKIARFATTGKGT